MEAVTTTAIATSVEPVRDVAKPDALERPRVLRVTASYLLSEAGRKAALLAGRSGRERQRVRVPVLSHRLHLVTVDADGTARLKLRPRYDLRLGRVIRIDALPIFDHSMTSEELLLVAAKNHELEQAWHAQRASKTAGLAEALSRREQIAQAFLTDRTQRALEHPTPSPAWCYLSTDDGRMLFDVTKGSPLSRTVPPEAHRRFQADLRARRWQNQQRRAVEEAHHDEKKRFVAEWMFAHGTPDQQARQRAGLLPMKEAIDMIADHIFAPARECPLYPHDGAACLQAHLRTLPQYAEAVVTKADLAHSFVDAKAATASQWARAQAIQRLLPDARVTPRFHRLSWRKDPRAPSLIRYGVLAVQTLGPLTLRREYEAGD